MARLNTANAAERALVPAFVWFFMMLYPFGWINRGWFAGDPKWLRRVAGAAGGCVLVEAATLAQAKLLMRQLLQYHLAGQALATRQMMIDLHNL